MFTLAILSLGALSYVLLQSAVVPALSDFQQSFHTTENGAAWILTANLLAASVATPIIGRLGDMHGKERMLLWTYVVLGMGTLMAALVHSIALLCVARAIQGVGAGIFPLAFGIIRDEFPRERVAGAIGLLSAIFGIGGGLGIVLGGLIVEHLSWQWLFWLPLIAIVFAAGLTARYIPESPIRVPGRINWLSAALMAAGVTAILVAVSEATTWGWISGKTLGLLVGGLGVCGTWILAELHAAEPLVDMAMMRIRGVWTTNLAAFLLGGGMYASFILIPQLVETPKSSGYGFGASVLAGGIFLLPSTVTMLAFGSMAGPLAARYGSKLLLIAGGILSAAAFAALAFAHSEPWEIYLASALLGAGIGLVFAALGTLIIQAVPPGQTGVATAMNTLMRSVGGAVGSQIAATLLAGQVLASGLPDEHGYVLAFATSLGFLVVCVLACLAIPTQSQGLPRRIVAEEA